MADIFRCRYCTDERHPGCHATCKKYKEDRAEYDRIKATHEAERGLNDYQMKLIVQGMDNRARIHKRKAGIIKPPGR